MAKTKAASKRGPKPRTALSDAQIIAAKVETLRIHGDGRVEWSKPVKLVATKAGVSTRTVQNWRDRKKTPMYWEEIVRLLFSKAPQAERTSVSTGAPSALTEQEVSVLFKEAKLPVISKQDGQPYYDWKAYWDHMQAYGLIIPRKLLP